MSKKRKKNPSHIILPGWESQNIVKSFPEKEKEDEKPCKKVGFSQIKRASKEEAEVKYEDMEFDIEKVLPLIEEMYRAQRRGRQPKKRIIVKRIKKDDNNVKKND